ncbi:aldo/keto reductase [Massilibacteroides sp.]|uniref:aldo/keto reductase n=1 Tax=Massilibacteroides sp. TaxID=2034766 RepID=UPI002612D2A4|nr:aldo/keto reductase [Massilibacteroides sp.]MDD4516622.1 aldo/keto reductase [Massilibacteroides sp.]
MEYRQLGASGLYVPVLTLGTATFGGTNGFEGWGATQVTEATRMVNLCMDAGLNLFDTADVYSRGLSEEILGKAVKGQRDKLLISTKATFRMGDDRNQLGSSRFHIIKACEDSLKRLDTDYIDIYHMHGFDANTPIEETLHALDTLVSSGKVRYIACSNFSGWHLMKSLSISEKYGWSRYVAHQVYYSLLNREFEWELMPLGIDQKVGSLVWSPLAAGRLGGKYRRNQPIPADGRVARGGSPIPEEATSYERLYAIMDVLDQIAEETGKSVAQISLNWLLQRPTISSLVIGASSEEQLKKNLGAVDWNLTADQVKRLDKASHQQSIYPYWHQAQFPELNSQLKFE